MAKMKLILSDELKMKLDEMRQSLAGIELEPNSTDPTLPAGCGHYCMVTCSWHCEDKCVGSCRGVSGKGCAYKYVDPCGYYMKKIG